MTKLYHRSATVDRSAIDIENRTVALSFSSTQPVERDFGLEILSHDPADIDLEFIQSGRAPFLVEHDREDQIGVILSATIDPDERGRAVVRFSRSPRGEEYFQDVIDEIRTCVSVGYAIRDYEVIDGPDGIPVAIVKWCPKEISIVSIPADISVGVGRWDINTISADDTVISSDETMVRKIKQEHKSKKSINSKDYSMTKNIKRQLEEIIDELQVETDPAEALDELELDVEREEEQEDETVENQAVAAERRRTADILAISTRHGVDANDAIRSGMTVNKFRAHVLDGLSSTPTVSTASRTLGMSKRELKQYSLGNAVRALATGDWSQAGLELEASRAAARAQNKVHTSQSLFIPSDYLTRDAGANAMTPTANAALVSTDYREQSFMDVLFAKSIASRLGVQFQDGLQGVVEIPKFSSGATARFVGTGVDGTIDAIGSGVVTLTPKTVVALAELTRSMVNQSSRLLEQWVSNHLQNKIAEALDGAVFGSATGSNAPAGISALAGLTKTAGSPTPLTWANIRDVVKAVENANADSDLARWALGPNVSARLETIEKTANTGIYLRDSDTGKIASRDSLVSTSVGNSLWFGDWSNVLVGSWSSIELAIDTSQKFASGGWIIRAITDTDVALLRNEAFSGYKALNV